MAIDSLQITGVRNLAPLVLSPSPFVNLVYGNNGSGKSSLLEAIHLLAYNRSFRTHKLASLIQNEADELVVFARTGTAQLGMQRDREGSRKIRLNGENLHSAAELANLLPVQLLDPGMFRLLEGTPQFRRQYIDWGAFHVEHNFFRLWRQTQKCIDMRNALLRQGRCSDEEKDIWNQSLAQHANELTEHRLAYLKVLEPLFQHYLQLLDAELELDLGFTRGWQKDADLYELLTESWERDKKQGFTQVGPQRADLKFKTGGKPALEVLSRGQQKIVVSALKLAQANHYQKHHDTTCIFLLDDLAAELDFAHRKALCALLEDLKCQVFVTAVEPDILNACWQFPEQVARFHVEHGRIQQQ